MMEKALWDKWTRDWNWILTIAQKRNWRTGPLEIRPPIDITQIVLLEEKLGLQYPSEFKFVLTNYSSNVNLY